MEPVRSMTWAVALYERMVSKMATRKATKPVKKSDWMRSMFDLGKTVAEVTHMSTEPATLKANGWTTGIGYGFAHGVATRAGVVAKAANRRKAKRVTQDSTGVSIVTSLGVYRVNFDGTFVRPHVPRTTTKPTVKATSAA